MGVPAAVFPEVKDREEGVAVAAVMIGIDPHKASHTAVAIRTADVQIWEYCTASGGLALSGQGRHFEMSMDVAADEVVACGSVVCQRSRAGRLMACWQ